jgi:Holliday junction resolvasome RuvABC DNA-binding subunit
MIAFLRGNIIYSDIEKSLVILDVKGVGYEIFLPVNQMYFSQFFLQQNNYNYDDYAFHDDCHNDNNMGAINRCTSFFIYTYVREDRIVLYGFPNFTQRELFSILLDTKDIGPKLAVTILSNINADDFINLILTKNIAGLSSIKGIGTLTAERIVSGLKNKIVKRFNSFKDVEAANIGGNSYSYDINNGESGNSGLNVGTSIANVYDDGKNNENNNSLNGSLNNENNNSINNYKSNNSVKVVSNNNNSGYTDNNNVNANSQSSNITHNNSRNSNKNNNSNNNRFNNGNSNNSTGKNIIYETALALNALGYSMADSIELASRTSKDMQEQNQIAYAGTKAAYICEINTENLIKECLKHIYKNKILS